MVNDNITPEQNDLTFTRRAVLRGIKWGAAACAVERGFNFSDDVTSDTLSHGLKETFAQGERAIRSGHALDILQVRGQSNDDFTPSF